ncbi:hypothetical protein [Anthocerotibacter panamensis]|uniref:hypothetical protein n=1 Tax=Anthocerotibacter panamensis TaxID=2857077 RepID=UPI001C405CF6|nr:hypothetical protein [Anthocerotibacter panamensis]
MVCRTTKKINTSVTPPTDATEDTGDYITVEDAHNAGYLNPFRSTDERAATVEREP